MICMRGRIRRSRANDIEVSSSPSKRIRPACGAGSRTSAFATLDLPQPDSPTSPNVSPCRTWKLTPETA
jgi:hypothetical protein